MLGFNPRDFWQATPRELFAAIRGYEEKHGLKDKAKKTTTKEEYLDLKAWEESIRERLDAAKAAKKRKEGG